MCCRYHLKRKDYVALLTRLGIAAPASYLSRYNIAPGTAIPAVRHRPSGREVAALRWGLVPSWAKSDEPSARLVNARAETLAAKPSFRDALRSRRCVIPASGFYEWKSTGRTKQPWLFHRHDEQPFALAGLWDHWSTPDRETVESCAVITTDANELMRPIHHRMPVMLTPEQCLRWLDPHVTDEASLALLLVPPPEETMTAIALHTHVSNVQHDGPECLQPAAPLRADESSEPQLSLRLE